MPAGIGDIVIGATAIELAYVLRHDASFASPLAVVWNLAGILDLLVAVGIAFFASTTPLRWIATVPSTDLLSVPPLVMVPVFGVPLFIVLHLVSLERLTRARAPRRSMGRETHTAELAAG